MVTGVQTQNKGTQKDIEMKDSESKTEVALRRAVRLKSRRGEAEEPRWAEQRSRLALGGCTAPSQRWARRP